MCRRWTGVPNPRTYAADQEVPGQAGHLAGQLIRGRNSDGTQHRRRRLSVAGVGAPDRCASMRRLTLEPHLAVGQGELGSVWCATPGVIGGTPGGAGLGSSVKAPVGDTTPRAAILHRRFARALEVLSRRFEDAELGRRDANAVTVLVRHLEGAGPVLPEAFPGQVRAEPIAGAVLQLAVPPRSNMGGCAVRPNPHRPADPAHQAAFGLPVRRPWPCSSALSIRLTCTVPSVGGCSGMPETRRDAHAVWARCARPKASGPTPSSAVSRRVRCRGAYPRRWASPGTPSRSTTPVGDEPHGARRRVAARVLCRRSGCRPRAGIACTRGTRPRARPRSSRRT
jgi:hypothetical protein